MRFGYLLAFLLSMAQRTELKTNTFRGNNCKTFEVSLANIKDNVDIHNFIRAQIGEQLKEGNWEISINAEVEVPPDPKPAKSQNCADVCNTPSFGNAHSGVGFSKHGEVAKIYPEFAGANGIEVFCDCSNDGAWLVFQRRVDDSVDFFRNWRNYSEGFGNIRGNYWLGLEAIHNITTSGRYELKIEMEKASTAERETVRYSSFYIDGKNENYALFLGEYTGSLNNDLEKNNGSMFSTFDRDNDKANEEHCARRDKSGWWFWACTHVDLNADYNGKQHVQTIRWYNFGNLKMAEMKMRLLI